MVANIITTQVGIPMVVKRNWEFLCFRRLNPFERARYNPDMKSCFGAVVAQWFLGIVRGIVRGMVTGWG